MAPRATWKGHLKLSELAFPIALYAGATTSKRVSFNILNRKTGNRVRREYVDEETGKPVEREEQVKGYESGDNHYIILEPEEVAGAIPESDKTINIECFIPCDEVDTVYFDRPYFIAPTGAVGTDSFAVIREGMRQKNVAALGHAVLFNRARSVLLRPEGPGLVANTLNFDYEVRSTIEAFDELPEVKIEGEMLDLAKHIIDTKKGEFDPRAFDDRYDQALAELVRAKMEGREIELPKPPKETKVVDLMDALRKSAKTGGKAAQKRQAGKRKGAAASRQRRKTG